MESLKLNLLIKNLLDIPEVKISVWDEEGLNEKRTNSNRKINAAINSVDESYLRVYINKEFVGGVLIVDNEIADYSLSLDKYISI